MKENATIFESSAFYRPRSSSCLSLVFSCRTCDKAFIFELDYNASCGVSALFNGDSSNTMEIDVDSCVRLNGNGYGNILDMYPKQQELVVPEHLTEIVSKNFKKAKELIKLGYYDQSGMTSRRVVDLATKELLPEHTGMLNSRIKQLLDKGVITQQLFDWADIIKLGGNSANHDYDDFTEHEAQQLLDFTEMFLMYAFTLPKMVEIKKQENTTD